MESADIRDTGDTKNDLCDGVATLIQGKHTAVGGVRSGRRLLGGRAGCFLGRHV